MNVCLPPTRAESGPCSASARGEETIPQQGGFLAPPYPHEDFFSEKNEAPVGVCLPKTGARRMVSFLLSAS